MTTKNCANSPKPVLKDLCEKSCAKCPVFKETDSATKLICANCMKL